MPTGPKSKSAAKTSKTSPTKLAATSASSSAAPVRTLDDKLINLTAAQMQAILASIEAAEESPTPQRYSPQKPTPKRKASSWLEPPIDLQSAVGSPTLKKKQLGNTLVESTPPPDPSALLAVLDAGEIGAEPPRGFRPTFVLVSSDRVLRLTCAFSHTKKKTEKALAAEQEQAAAKPRSRVTCLYPERKNPSGESRSASPSPVKKEPVEKMAHASMISLSSDNDSLPEVSSPLVTPPSRNQHISKYIDGEAAYDSPADEDGADEDGEEEKSFDSLEDFIVRDSEGEDPPTPKKGAVASTPSSSDIGAAGPNGRKNSEPTITPAMLLCADLVALAEALLPYSDMVMQPLIQDPQLVPSYEGLPHLPNPANFVPYGYDREVACGEPYNVHFTSIAENLGAEDFASLCAGIKFVSYGNFVNLARVDPSLLTNRKKRIALVDSKAPFCAGIMCGVTTASHLIGDNYVVPSSGIGQRRVTIAPFFQEIRRDLAVAADVMKIKDFKASVDPKGSISTLGILFVSRGEGRFAGSNVTSPSPSTPRKATPAFLKNSSMFGAVQSPKKASSATLFASTTNTVVDFDATIPVYDGCSQSGDPFRFTGSDFDLLFLRPLYRGRPSEVPEEAVVAVGYSISCFGSDDSYINTNALFIIILGLPKRTIG
ncbi:hypothetical protein DXG01_010804 [Tephrocybe rancida]|nr:hypothetical protein DXG01_010804 [Tephrocybe rancida]